MGTLVLLLFLRPVMALHLLRRGPLLFSRHAVFDRWQQGASMTTSSTPSSPVMVMMVSMVMGVFSMSRLLHTFIVLADLLPQFRQLLFHILFALKILGIYLLNMEFKATLRRYQPQLHVLTYPGRCESFSANP